ncbi:ribose ABC transporter permease [Aquibacillus halophilus]|uniref:Ribose ABC transporter permease n=1 Tax=Aquibacillus halophilus TaxID=930132 RepID=A0A6A8D5W6_9BACI|nr:ABC transporter permease [Aquibacillus halophilus]MRH41155.1 ribose ABC transporter permease [Aquibacillus halophilus]
MSELQVNKAEINKIPIGKKILKNDNTYLLTGLILYIVVISMIAPNFATQYNFSVVLQQLVVPAILAVGMCLVMVSGGIDLSVGNLLSLAACFMAFVIYNGGSVFVAILSAIVICVAGNLFVGFIISRTDLEPFIVTLGMMIAYKGLALITTNGAEFPIMGEMGFATSIRFFNFPLMIFIMIAVYILFWFIFRYSRFGRRLYAVGDNPEAAFLAGINVKNFKLLVYGINGLLVALASIIMLSRNEVGNPYLGTGLELDAIAAAVVGGTALSGGKGNIIGTFLGAVWIGIISNSLNVVGVSAFVQYIVTGGIIIAAVLVNSLRSKNA